MFALSLTEDVELRPLEPWRAEEFLAHLDRARTHIAPWVSPSFLVDDLAGARAVLQRYADLWARDAGGIWGIWRRGTLVGGVMFVSFDAASGGCEAGCWLEPAGEGHGLVSRAVGRLVDWAVTGTRHPPRRVAHQAGQHPQHRHRPAARHASRRDAAPVYPGPAGRIDIEVWSVLAPEWRGFRSDAGEHRVE